MIRDMRHDFGDLRDIDDEGGHHPNESDPFQQLVGDDAEQLYPGCTCFSKLCFVVRLLHIKSLGGWTDKSFNMLLELLKEAFSTLVYLFCRKENNFYCLVLTPVSQFICRKEMK